MINYEEICLQVCDIAKKAGDFIAQERESFSLDKVEYKGHQDLVSYVDKQAERIVVENLLPLVEGAKFITEEQTIERDSSHSGHYWIIDPLDGTTNFVHGAPPFCVSIALACGEEIVVGVVYEVTAKECFYSWKGSVAYLNGRQINVSTIGSMKDSLIVSGFSSNSTNRIGEFVYIMSYLTTEAHGIRRIGSAAADLAYLAAGRYEGFLQFNLSEWDVAAGAFIVQCAGGKVTDYSGGDNYIFGRELVASNGALHSQMIALAQESLTKR